MSRHVEAERDSELEVVGARDQSSLNRLESSWNTPRSPKLDYDERGSWNRRQKPSNG